MPKVTVITGASAGIGAATATLLAARGDQVALAGRDHARLGEVAAACGGSALAVIGDVTSRADVERLRDQTLAAFGRIDVWINNAGRGITRSVLELTDDDVTDMIDTNLRSVLYGMQAVVPHFIEQGAGHVINVSSFLARVPLAPWRSAYSASKAAMNSLTTSLRMDLEAAYPGIHLTVVMPGVVTTGFARSARGSNGMPSTPPPGGPMRPQSADEVAAVIARVIDHPVAEVYTNPASPEVARRYFDQLGAFSPLQS
jgi:NAD(P)-dependent dehydrogenase (short-subunit alcohol dehydrogenase family)